VTGIVGEKPKRDRAALLANLEKARAVRKEKKVYPGLKTKYADMGEWERLASEFGVRLPPGIRPCTTGDVYRWVKKIGLELSDIYSWSGTKTLKEFVELTPTWTARAVCALILEHREFMLEMRSWPK
jgi:hypothetical protein